MIALDDPRGGVGFEVAVTNVLGVAASDPDVVHEDLPGPHHADLEFGLRLGGVADGIGDLLPLGLRRLIAAFPGAGDRIVLVGIQQLEARPSSICPSRPEASIVVPHFVYRVASRVHQAQALSLIAQLALEGADDRQDPPALPGRFVGASKVFGVCRDGEIGAACKDRSLFEGIGDAAVEAEPADVDVLFRAIEELDKRGQLASIGGMVHDLVDHDAILERNSVGGAGRGSRGRHEAPARVRVERIAGSIERRGYLGRIIEHGRGEDLEQVGAAQEDGNAFG